MKHSVFLALQTLQAGRVLPSRNANGTLSGDLASLYSRISATKMDIKSTATLLNLVVRRASDEKIWSAVFSLVAITRTTPPTAFEKADFDTPLRSSSASQGIEQSRDEVDQRILEEPTGRVYYDTGGFHERYFEEKAWTNHARDIYEESRTQYTEGRWSGCPDPLFQSPFFVWFLKFQDNVLSGLARRYYTSGNKVLRGSEADRKLDIFLAPAGATFKGVQLAGYAREVFGSQPERRFVPGFTICGTVMRLWVFDRSGAYNSEMFDIHKELKRFVKVLAGYMMMSNTELGLNTFIKRDRIGKCIIIQDVRVPLEDRPIASTKAIVCRGTACYRGRRGDSTEWGCVVKFAWPSDKRQREGDLLKLAKDRGVKGITECLYYEQITIDGSADTIAHLRVGLKFGVPRKFSSKASWIDNGTESSRANSRTRSRNTVRRLTGSAPESSTIKRFKSDNSSFNHSIQEGEPDSLVGCESETYGNRIHCCLVLLEALRDAIRGHKSLLEVGKILHGDVSENNIIITEATTKGDPKGMLIDLDLAKELDNRPSGASHRTGTIQFMAIEVFQGKDHTYRHDLKSFFYAFTWICIRYSHEDVAEVKETDTPGSNSNKRMMRPMTSRLQAWYAGTYVRIANTKRGHMDKNGYEDIIMEFQQKFKELKQLARELRTVLFPIKDGAIFTGTFQDHDIIEIDHLGEEEQAIA
ncbi:hypothetical protein BJ875DRAFT_537697 [Amylocarpus encephaloides]|uniref:Fungal-type protein kinase domain-containing protein n=1 Tax=Amylocarpus encephaloides TaxID=45428 RepID=A0A9P8C0Q5_9HELO|nr:hypothetical protein BJ875DRAFT_537697 [Amylocarpus encephaloides]